MNPEENNPKPTPKVSGDPSFTPSIRPSSEFISPRSQGRPSFPYTPNTDYLVPTPPPVRPPKHSWSDVLSTILLLTLAPVVALLIILFAIQSYQVDGQSMEPTLQNRDRLIVNKIPRTMARITGHSYQPHRGDIIIFNQTNLPDTVPGQNKQLIKRVIGLPGERVAVKNGKVVIYDKANRAGFNPDATTVYHTNSPTTTPSDHEWQIQSGQIFVMGDNRPNSEDSRYFGPINDKQIVGKLILRLLPLNKSQRF